MRPSLACAAALMRCAPQWFNCTSTGIICFLHFCFGQSHLTATYGLKIPIAAPVTVSRIIGGHYAPEENAIIWEIYRSLAPDSRGHIFGIIPLIDYISIDRIRVIIVHLKIVLGRTLNCSPDKGWIAGRSEASWRYGCCLARGCVRESEAHVVAPWAVSIAVSGLNPPFVGNPRIKCYIGLYQASRIGENFYGIFPHIYDRIVRVIDIYHFETILCASCHGIPDIRSACLCLQSILVKQGLPCPG